jgi:hypothetical protein
MEGDVGILTGCERGKDSYEALFGKGVLNESTMENAY